MMYYTRCSHCKRRKEPRTRCDCSEPNRIYALSIPRRFSGRKVALKGF